MITGADNLLLKGSYEDRINCYSDLEERRLGFKDNYKFLVTDYGKL